jgi:hypothetical protein
MATPFDEFTNAYPKALASFETCLKGSYLPQLEAIALRFAHAVEEETIDLREGNEREFLSAILARATSEMFAMIGAMRNGALLPSYHNARAILELFASIEHVYCNSSTKLRKLEKFVEYPKVAKYLHFQSCTQQLAAGEITEETFKKKCPLTEIEYQEIEKRFPDWQRIWNLDGADPKVVQHWHHSADITALFASSELTRECWNAYGMISHATHLSPLGKNITHNHCLIGFPLTAIGTSIK